MSRSFLLASILLLCLISFSAALSCLDGNKNSVAWFNALKYPNNITKAQARYAYLDSNGGDAFQVIKGVYADDESQPLYLTITAINSMISSSDLNLLIFNDEGPAYKSARGTRGVSYSDYTAHAKGIVAYDNSTKTGVYIQHSFPKYPNINHDGTIYPKTPKNTYDYGQNIYCMSLDETSFNKIYINFPIANYVTYVTTGLFANMPKTSNDNYKVTEFTLLNGETQYMITKNPTYKGFLYDDIMAPYFQANLAVESWGRPYQKSQCTGQEKTVNILEIAVNAEDTWTNHDDHSKWAVTTSGMQLGCNCDMNRQTSQGKRGGSCFCTPNKNHFTALSNLITKAAKCDYTGHEVIPKEI